MTYDKDKILKMLEQSNLDAYGEFHEGKNDDFICSFAYSCYHGNSCFEDGFYHNNGASKLVLIPRSEKEDYVIKIPYTGCWSKESGYYYNSIYHSGYEDYFDFINLIPGQERSWDFCERETYRYKIAKEYNFEQCFAKTEFIGFARDYPIYVQEKCITLSDCISKHQHTQEEKTKTSKICTCRSINLNWLTDFRLYYGEETLINFTNFIKNEEWDDDLRNDNIGYLCGRPVLIDYSGFLDQ